MDGFTIVEKMNGLIRWRNGCLMMEYEILDTEELYDMDIQYFGIHIFDLFKIM